MFIRPITASHGSANSRVIKNVITVLATRKLRARCISCNLEKVDTLMNQEGTLHGPKIFLCILQFLPFTRKKNLRWKADCVTFNCQLVHLGSGEILIRKLSPSPFQTDLSDFSGYVK